MKLKVGDIVKYRDVESKMEGKKYTSVKVDKYGFWDGKKVQLMDKEKTIVRNPDWLEVVTPDILIDSGMGGKFVLGVDKMNKDNILFNVMNVGYEVITFTIEYDKLKDNITLKF